MKKGQAALEYLMTYGWAILIVVIIGVALYAMGVFSPGRFTGKSYSGLSEFTVLDWKLADGGTNDSLTLIVTPRGHTFNITSVSVTVSGLTMSSTCSINPQLANPDQKVTISCYTNGTDIGIAGATYTADVTISYTDVDTNVTHTSTGKLKGTIE